jgi:ribosome production factor 2
MAPTPSQLKATKAKALAGGRPAKARTQRYLKSIEPRLREGAKGVLLLRGIKCSHAVGGLLRDVRAMRAPNAKLLTKRNMFVPFETEGQRSLEFLTTKNDCALFMVGSTNKKRPNNLVVGRTFDRQVLDVVELAVLRYKGISDYGGSVPKKRLGSKPLMLFLGDLWQHDADCKRMQNLLVDLYRGDVVDSVVASGLDHLLVFAAVQHPTGRTPVIHHHTYHCKLKKDPTDPSSAVPAPHLVPCGPDMTLQIRRSQFAEPDLWNAALKQPQGQRKKGPGQKAKNRTTNMFGEVLGRLHLERQEVDRMGGRKSKALRRAEKAAAEEEMGAVEEELGKESDELKQEFKQTFGFASE